jgi:hypothetical protein
MDRTDIERKRKTPWPWLAGLALLVVTLLGISVLLTQDADAEPQVTVPTVEGTYSPAAIPAPPDMDPVLTGTDPARDLAEIAPLGEEDVGQMVRLEGQVVATGNEAFWLLAGDRVLRVDSPRRVRKGDTLSVRGTLRPADPRTTDLIASDVLSRHPSSGGWNVVRVLKLVEEESAPAGGDGDAAPRPEA